MNYRAVVYYHGPKTEWSGNIDPTEVIVDCSAPWLWMARMIALRSIGNTGRCGYVILRENEVVDRSIPTEPAYG